MLVAIIMKLSALFFALDGDHVSLRLQAPDFSEPQVTCTSSTGCR